MIKAVAAFPRLHVDAMVHDGMVRVPHFDETWVVSISTPDCKPLGVDSHPFVLRVVFDDLDPDTDPDHASGLPIIGCSAKAQLFSPEQALQIVGHVSHAHARPGRVFLLVHCDMGVSRSGAVALWAACVAGISEDNVRARSPRTLDPNRYVTRLLREAHQ